MTDPRSRETIPTSVGAGFTQGAERYDDVLAHNASGARRLVAAVPPGDYPEILDVGCGTGFAATEMARRFGCRRIVGVDTSEGMLAVFRDKASRSLPGTEVELHVADALAIPLPDASVDAVVSSMAFHWFPDKPGALREMARVVRPGGIVAVLASGTGADAELQELMRALRPPLPSAWVEVFAHILRDVPEMQDMLRRTGLEAVDVWMESRRRLIGVADYLARLQAVGSHLSAGMDPDVAQGHVERLGAAMAALAGPDGFPYTFNKLFAIARRPT